MSQENNKKVNHEKEGHEGEEKKLSLNILEYVTEIQNQNGLKNGNFHQYHHFCSRRIHRIKRCLKCTHGRGKYQPKPILPSSMTDVRHLMIPLVMAERAWSMATEIKEELKNAKETDKKSRKKLHFLSRLEKAAKWAQQLEQLSVKRADGRTILESEAYSAWMFGLVFLEREKWQEALQKFYHSKTIYEQLASVSSYAHKDNFQKRVVQEIEPSIRFCEYNLNKKLLNSSSLEQQGDIINVLGMQKATMELLKSKFEDVLEIERKKQTGNVEAVLYGGNLIPVKSEKLRRSVLQNQEIQTEIASSTSNESKLRLYEKLILSYGDMLNMIRAEIKEKSKDLTSTALETFMKNMRSLHQFATYESLSATMERNLRTVTTLLADKKNPTKHVSIVKLYDSILNLLHEMETLPGIEEGDDKELLEEIQLKTLHYRALHCYYLSRAYEEVERWAEAMALLKRSDELAQMAQSSLLKSSKQKTNPKMENIGKEISAFLETIRKEQCLLLVRHVMREKGLISHNNFEKMMIINGKNQDVKVEKEAVLSNLMNYSIERHGKPLLIEFPPDYELIIGKPFFFDKAVNYIVYPETKQEKKWYQFF